MSDFGNALDPEALPADAILAQREEEAYQGRRRMFDRCHKLLGAKRSPVPVDELIRYMLNLGQAEQALYLNLVNLRHRPQRGMSIKASADGSMQVDLFEEYDNWSDERIESEAKRLLEQAGWIEPGPPAVGGGKT
jgi:hypothetical protein